MLLQVLTVVFLAGFLRREVQVFDGDGFHATGLGFLGQGGEGTPDLAVVGRSGQVVAENLKDQASDPEVAKMSFPPHSC
ncbi:MAG: hypothetical protein JO362_23675 [Streptomycetaceae bacterium]|nr:hypothetical protein [Streptomycetaceae bacterium]